MQIIYADNNATTPIAPEVVEAMMPFLTTEYFNPSSMYEPARHAAEGDQSRPGRKSPGFSDWPIPMRSCLPVARRRATTRRSSARSRRIRTAATSSRRPSNIRPSWESARNWSGKVCDVTFLGVDRDGNLDIGEFIRALRPDTLLVTIMHANNETGVIFPDRTALAADEGNRPCHHLSHRRDAIGRQDSDRPAAGISVRRYAVVLRPQGPCPEGRRRFVHQARHAMPAVSDRRASGGRPPGRDGKRALHRRPGQGACNWPPRISQDEDTRVRGLRDRLEKAIEERIPYVEINGRGAPRLPNTLNVSCHGVEGESMLFQLSEFGICASSGSACTSGSLEPSHVLRAMKVPDAAVQGSVRFSLSRYNTDADMDRIIEAFPKMVANVRRISPYWDQEKNAPRLDSVA